MCPKDIRCYVRIKFIAAGLSSGNINKIYVLILYYRIKLLWK